MNNIEAAQEFKREMIKFSTDSLSLPNFIFTPLSQALIRCFDENRLFVVYFHSKRHHETANFVKNVICSASFKELFEHDLHRIKIILLF